LKRALKGELKKVRKNLEKIGSQEEKQQDSIRYGLRCVKEGRENFADEDG
jgi:hypothetical protein